MFTRKTPSLRDGFFQVTGLRRNIQIRVCLFSTDLRLIFAHQDRYQPFPSWIIDILERQLQCEPYADRRQGVRDDRNDGDPRS